MYRYNKNKMEINAHSFEFEYSIKKVVQYNSKYIVMFDLPLKCIKVSNICCLDENAKPLWQAEDLNEVYPGRKNIPYEFMSLSNDDIIAYDFYGHSFKINIDNGKIKGSV